MNALAPEQITVRLHMDKGEDGIVDYSQDFELSDFADFLPSLGDLFLDPGCLQGLDRHQPENRRMYRVLQRVFNPRDLPNYVVLIVEEFAPTGRERVFVTPR